MGGFTERGSGIPFFFLFFNGKRDFLNVNASSGCSKASRKTLFSNKSLFANY